MTKLLLLVVAAAAVFLASCGGAEPTSGTVVLPATPAPTATPGGAAPTSTTAAQPNVEPEAPVAQSTPTMAAQPTAAPEAPVAQPTPTTAASTNADVEIAYATNPTWFVAPSLEEQIYDALRYDTLVVVRASLLSAAAGAEEVPAVGDGAAATYRPVHDLRFTVHEYLEGSGPTEILVVVRGDLTFPTEASALRQANYAASRRNTSWDDRQAVLFVGLGQTTTEAAGTSGLSGSSPARTAEFLRSNPLESPWDYTVDNLSRAWLPAQAAAAGQSGQSTVPAFITDGAQSPAPTITLADLKAKIAALQAELKAGEGIEGFERCIRGRILHERVYRAEPGGARPRQKTIASGLAAGAEIYSRENNHGHPEYSLYWLNGPDASLFQSLNVDDDQDSSTGYTYTLSTERPLRAGEYRVHYIFQHYTDIPCNFKPTNAYRDWTVTVTAPSGTVHEAYFDPVAGAGGVPIESEFTIGGTSTAVQWLEWLNGSVNLLLFPYADLSGHALEFIALDGTAALSLDAGAATVDSATGMLTWAVAAQPWQEGDELMLRIRKSGTTPPTPTET